MNLLGAVELTRMPPKMPARAYRSFTIRQPRDVLVRTACELAGCQAWANGWESTVDEATGLGRAQAAYIREKSGRTFREMRSASGLTVFRFDRGQRCFTDHRTRPVRFGERAGDWRGNPTGQARGHTAASWVDQFAAHQERLARAAEWG